MNVPNKLFAMALCLLVTSQAQSIDVQEVPRPAAPPPKPVVPAPVPKPPPGPSAAEIQARQEAREAKAEAARAKQELAEVIRAKAATSSPAVVVAPPPPPPPLDTPFKETEAFPGGPIMVSLPPGTFMMGSREYDDEKDSQGGPHRVTLGYKFAIGQTEVTVAQYMACVNDAQSCEPPKGTQGGGDFPVVGVSWAQAGAYAEWVTRKAGLAKDSPNRFRRPTESEWEYAASEGGKTKWSGTSVESEISKYANNGNKLEAVKRRTANKFKLYDMSGNVWEWVEDLYKSNYSGVPVDGRAYGKPGDSGARVVRGGSWSSGDVGLRAANRINDSPGDQNNGLGFRLARTEF